jgi:RNA polymerase sigma factor (sigma-70 family)
MNEKFEVAIVGKIKHGILHRFLKEKGWTGKKLAEHLASVSGLSVAGLQIQVSRWLNLRDYPRNEKVMTELERLTGTLREDLFPEFMRAPSWKETIKQFPRELVGYREVEVQHLLGGRRLALPSAEDEYIVRELQEKVRMVITDLKPREQRILELRFGLGDEVPNTLSEIGKVFGVSDQRIEEIIRFALHKIRMADKSILRLRDFV